ncbi:MAG: proline dehydrogenase family protein [Chloroflexota bacterium]
MTAMFRPAVLRIAEMPAVRRFVQENPASRSLVERFVAGETLDEAIDRSRAVARLGMSVTLDLLGDNVRAETEARAAVDRYIGMFRRMAEAGLEPNISVKLTMLGLDIADSLAAEGLDRLLATAREVSGFVRADMEGSAYTARTLAIVGDAHARYPDEVGTVIQSCLHRSDADIDWAIARGVRIRLVKGAYAEPAGIAWQDRESVDGAYIRQMERLLDAGRYPAIATHDAAIIRSARGYALRMGIPGDRFEFQMLYGVRRDLQRELVREGCRMRIYVPYGRDWYPYFARRVAERPANALFVLRQFAG